MARGDPVTPPEGMEEELTRYRLATTLHILPREVDNLTLSDRSCVLLGLRFDAEAAK